MWSLKRNTVEPRLTVTSLVRSPHNYGHPGSVPICILQCKLAPCNTVTYPLRSLLPSPGGDLISEVPLYILHSKNTYLAIAWLIPESTKYGKMAFDMVTHLSIRGYANGAMLLFSKRKDMEENKCTTDIDRFVLKTALQKPSCKTDHTNSFVLG